MTRFLPFLLLALTGCTITRPQGASSNAQEMIYVREIAALPVRCPTDGLYRLEYSNDLTHWTVLARNCCGNGTNEITLHDNALTGFARLVKQKGWE